MKTEVITTAALRHDNLSDDDYRDIYQEIRAYDEVTGKYAVSLDAFVGLISSDFSKAQWSKYHRGLVDITDDMRNELRRAVGLPALGSSIGDAVAAYTRDDATVTGVGDQQAKHVVLVGCEYPIALTVNGEVTARRVTSVTRPKRKRKRYVRPVASVEQEERRKALGVNWKEVIEEGLRSYEQ